MPDGAEELLEGVAGEWEGDRHGGDSAGGAGGYEGVAGALPFGHDHARPQPRRQREDGEGLLLSGEGRRILWLR